MAEQSKERLTDLDLRCLLEAYERQLNPTPLFADAVLPCLRELQERRASDAACPVVSVRSGTVDGARYTLARSLQYKIGLDNARAAVDAIERMIDHKVHQLRLDQARGRL